MEAKAFLDTYLAIVKDKPPGYTTEVVKHLLPGLQEALCILTETGHDKDFKAVAQPATEDLDNLPLSTEVDSGFSPVNLDGVAGIILQGHIRLGWM